MTKRPFRPCPLARSADDVDSAARGRVLIGRADRRQAELFAPPAFIAPCKPTLRERVPLGPRWQYEIKHDGYRTQVRVHAGRVTCSTKSGIDYAGRLPRIMEGALALGRDVILDGEAVMTTVDGVTDFFAVHAALVAENAPAAFLYAFDVLWLDGEDLRGRPLSERGRILADLLAGAGGSGIELVEHLAGDGEAMLAATRRLGLEGIVAKLVDQPYRSGRSEGWIKVRNVVVEAFAVIGFKPFGRAGVASLSLARLATDGSLSACGSVGSGLSEQTSRALRHALEREAAVVVEVEHRGFTPAGELRHPVFKGWHLEG